VRSTFLWPAQVQGGPRQVPPTLSTQVHLSAAYHGADESIMAPRFVWFSRHRVMLKFRRPLLPIMLRTAHAPVHSVQLMPLPVYSRPVYRKWRPEGRRRGRIGISDCLLHYRAYFTLIHRNTHLQAH
jgi:hypothetical protein